MSQQHPISFTFLISPVLHRLRSPPASCRCVARREERILLQFAGFPARFLFLFIPFPARTIEQDSNTVQDISS